MKIVIGLINFLLKRNLEMAKMKHLETQKITDDAYAIKTKNANFYIIKNGDRYISIDAGGGNKNIAENELKKLNIKTEKTLPRFYSLILISTIFRASTIFC